MMMDGNLRKFKSGDRVKLSRAGLSTVVRRDTNLAAQKRGLIVTKDSGKPVTSGCARVKWDDKKTAETYHEDFLELAESTQ